MNKGLWMGPCVVDQISTLNAMDGPIGEHTRCYGWTYGVSFVVFVLDWMGLICAS
jgi:hypothetical protein